MPDSLPADFTFSNLTGRPPGPVVSFLSRLLPGVRDVQAQTAPYAQAWAEHNREALVATGPLWVVLGDSMSQGIGASRYDRGWVGQLAPSLPGHRCVNLSMSGGRIQDVLDLQLPAMASLGVEPALLTVMIGTNDLMSPPHRGGAARRLSMLLDRLPPGTIIGNQPGRYSDALEFNRLIDEAVAHRGQVLAEFRDPRMRGWKGRLAADHFHPNDAGYAVMAEIVAEALTRR
ncbi:SGNH/GDSL hydrolase family protein [Pseudonocardia sp.]|uniref:SGNH/GDSL hydrolase family protein n=1 Tax=Pseudonocardia sp. TaxID=60912 RepID=UPI0031FD6EDE